MFSITRPFADRRARQHTERIAATFDGTAVTTVVDAPTWGPGTTAYVTVLPDGTRIEVAASPLLPFGLWTTVGVVLPDGYELDDEDSYGSFLPRHDDGILGLRHAYHKATGADLPTSR